MATVDSKVGWKRLYKTWSQCYVNEITTKNATTLVCLATLLKHTNMFLMCILIGFSTVIH